VRIFFGKGERGFSDADICTFGQKNFRFFEIYGVSARITGFEPVRTYFGKGGGVNFFAILCGRPLWSPFPNQPLIAKKKDTNADVNFFTLLELDFFRVQLKFTCRIRPYIFGLLMIVLKKTPYYL